MIWQQIMLILLSKPYNQINHTIIILFSQSDNTPTGHALGSVESRKTVPSYERDLSPPAVCIMRAIMHSALLWHSCQSESDDLVHIIKPFVNPQNIPEFFWMHLRKDIEHLSCVTGKGLEESAIIVHLVLHEMLISMVSHGNPLLQYLIN